MTFSERMTEFFEQTVEATKELAVKAGAKAQELGERGVLMIEIKQLESQAQKLIVRMGNEAYRAFVENDKPTLKRDSSEMKLLLPEIIRIKEIIEKKEAELNTKKV